MIVLRKLRLINWYGFNNVTLPIGLFTLIAGKNGNGKSVLLDAIKYALYADTVFNKSTENTGSRTVSSYTRGLLDATATTFMRPADKVPNVYTHIALEMENREIGNPFILGTVIETSASNNNVVRRYVVEGKTLEQVAHTYVDNGQIMPYSAEQLQKALGVKLLDVNDGMVQFMQRTGLRLNAKQLSSFRHKLRSIMSYNPDSKIDQFIRESVLEEKPLDFSKLVEAKKNIDSLTVNFLAIDDEIQELEKILELFERLVNSRNVLVADDIKIDYKQFITYTNEIKQAELKMDKALRETKQAEALEAELKVRESELDQRVRKAKLNLDALDCSRAIEEAKNALSRAQTEKQQLAKEREDLVVFQERVNEWQQKLEVENVTVENCDVLTNLTSSQFTKIEKEQSVEQLFQTIKQHRDNIFTEKTRFQDQIEDNEKIQSRLQEQLNEYNAKKTTFSQIPHYVQLKNDINREFAKRGIQSEARFACEYVLEITDEAWRNSIESYLGARRYTLLVEPEYYDIADDVLNTSKKNYAHLFNTKLLMKKSVHVQEQSVVQFINVKNPIAKHYFYYQLGRFKATTKEQVKLYENAISLDGRISVAMDSYFLQFDKIKFYCLGQDAIELNRVKTEQKLELYKQEHEALTTKKKQLESNQQYFERATAFFGQFNFEAYAEFDAAEKNCVHKEDELNQLIDAQNHNVEYMTLAELVESLEMELHKVMDKKQQAADDKYKWNYAFKESEGLFKKCQQAFDIVQANLTHFQQQHPFIYEKAIVDYQKHLENGPDSIGGILKDRDRTKRLAKQLANNLTAAQSAYNSSKLTDNHLPINDESRAKYEARKSKIWIDDLQQIRDELKQQTRRYEEIFKNEFVLTILKNCEAARDDLKRINAELGRLSFKSTYKFDYQYIQDGSDYGKIIEYAKYLKEREELGVQMNQLTLDEMTSYSIDEGEQLENNIRQIINRIVDSNDRNKIEDLADYRNYMSYEILLTNDILKGAKLSRQAGYNSGAEVQIPYMLILLSALLLIYNDKLSSTRLVFIDEPFAKMDPTNIKIMLNFMKEQRLQMIFCAPDKTELIGNECQVILPVLRTQANLMEIGIVEIREGV